jgi:hypothetical protein
VEEDQQQLLFYGIREAQQESIHLMRSIRLKKYTLYEAGEIKQIIYFMRWMRFNKENVFYDKGGAKHYD